MHFKKTNLLIEDTRMQQVASSRNAGPYKDQSRGKNRFERKKYSKIIKSVAAFNKINMNDLFKQDILQITIPVIGETDQYEVTIKMEGVIAELQKCIKNNKNKLEFKTIIQALTKVFNTTDIYTKCTCKDFEIQFAHWNIVNNISVDDSASDPGPGKGVANPNNDKGRGCKHILLVLNNGDWLMKVASTINNYIHYVSEHLQKAFLNIIFPKLYGVPADEAAEHNIVENNEDLKTDADLITIINEYGKNRGKFVKGSNINPVYADELEAEQKGNKQKKSEEDNEEE